MSLYSQPSQWAVNNISVKYSQDAANAILALNDPAVNALVNASTENGATVMEVNEKGMLEDAKTPGVAKYIDEQSSRIINCILYNVDIVKDKYSEERRRNISDFKRSSMSSTSLGDMRPNSRVPDFYKTPQTGISFMNVANGDDNFKKLISEVISDSFAQAAGPKAVMTNEQRQEIGRYIPSVDANKRWNTSFQDDKSPLSERVSSNLEKLKNANRMVKENLNGVKDSFGNVKQTVNNRKDDIKKSFKEKANSVKDNTYVAGGILGGGLSIAKEKSFSAFRKLQSVAKAKLNNFAGLNADVGNKVALSAFMAFGKVRNRVVDASKAVTRFFRVNHAAPALGVAGIAMTALALTGHLSPGAADMLHQHVGMAMDVAGRSGTKIMASNVHSLMSVDAVHSTVKALSNEELRQAMNANTNVFDMASKLSDKGVTLNDLSHMSIADVSTPTPVHTSNDIIQTVRHVEGHHLHTLPHDINPADHIKNTTDIVSKAPLGKVDGIDIITNTDRLQALKIASNLKEHGLSSSDASQLAQSFHGHAKGVDLAQGAQEFKRHAHDIIQSKPDTDALNNLSSEASRKGFSLADLMKDHSNSVGDVKSSTPPTTGVNVHTNIGGGTELHTHVAENGKAVSHVVTAPNAEQKPGFFGRVGKFFAELPDQTAKATKEAEKTVSGYTYP